MWVGLSRDFVSDSGSGFQISGRAAKNGFFRAATDSQVVREAFPPILRRLRGVIQSPKRRHNRSSGLRGRAAMDFDLALECVDPTTRRGDGEHAWTPTRAACKLCGDEQSDPRDAPCCGATVCAACIVS